MGIYIFRRSLYALALLFVISLVVFVLFAALPFDPASLTCGKNCTAEVIEANRIRLGYDLPMWEQYLKFLQGIFVGREYGHGIAAFSCPAPALGYSGLFVTASQVQGVASNPSAVGSFYRVTLTYYLR